MANGLVTVAFSRDILMKKGMEIGSRLAKEHAGELEDMIATRKKELDEKAKERE